MSITITARPFVFTLSNGWSAVPQDDASVLHLGTVRCDRANG